MAHSGNGSHPGRAHRRRGLAWSMKARLSLDRAERGAEGGPCESDDMETWETRRSVSGGGENTAEQKKRKQERVNSRGRCPVGRPVEVTRSGYSIAIRRGFLETRLSRMGRIWKVKGRRKGFG